MKASKRYYKIAVRALRQDLFHKTRAMYMSTVNPDILYKNHILRISLKQLFWFLNGNQDN